MMLIVSVGNGLSIFAKENGTKFTGEQSESDFQTGNVIKTKINYMYSNTGGLAGVEVATSDTIETEVKESDDRLVIEWELPVKTGYRFVLNADPINKYLVNPPTGKETSEEIADALNRGDYDLDVDNKEIFYNPDDHTEINPNYKNPYSDEYNLDWDYARYNVDRATDVTKDSYLAGIVGTANNTNPDGLPGASLLKDAKLEVTLRNKAEIKDALENGIEITVYYRRNAVPYTVNHWVPESLLTVEQLNKYTEEKTYDNETYRLVIDQLKHGRAGTLTKVEAATGEEDPTDPNIKTIFSSIVPRNLEQQIISEVIDEETMNPIAQTKVDIYYRPATTVSAIFDTDYLYIPRQQINFGGDVVFTEINENPPTRMGYTFDGWQYKNKDGQLVDVDTDTLTIDEAFAKNVTLEYVDDEVSIYFTPKWVADKTQVRVVLWTENLAEDNNLNQDVYAQAEGGNTDYYNNVKYANLKNQPITILPDEQGKSHYSNLHSFVGQWDTDSKLIDDAGNLNAQIKDGIDSIFEDTLEEEASCYNFAGYDIVIEKSDGSVTNTDIASGDGKTIINVYYTRKIYELQFHYYGDKGDDGNENDVALGTNGYSTAGFGKNYPFDFAVTASGANQNWYATLSNNHVKTFPRTITIRAKYGANLKEVWPSARHEEQVKTDEYNNNVQLVSWATTDGAYRDGEMNTGNREFTLMGTYGSMGKEIVADLQDDTVAHHLVAYWTEKQVSHYRYNHCFEIPDLDIGDNGVQRITLDAQDGTNEVNTLYLVPTTNATFTKYGFSDLMTANYNNGTVEYSSDGTGAYYVVRQHTVNGNRKYYAVAGRVQVTSTNTIGVQTPTEVQHVTRITNTPIHSTLYGNDAGASSSTIGTANNPYDLYFYYDRNRFTISYIAPIYDESQLDSESELGTITLPYGAKVDQRYNFKLEQDGKNQDYGWTVVGSDKSVCPDRNELATKDWTFKGWSLGPSGTNMQWNADSTPSGAVEEFYIEENMNLYAIWEKPSYTITFDLKGGKVSGSDSNTITVTIPANRTYSSVGSIPRPFRSGYILKEWIDKDTGKPFDFGWQIYQNHTVEATWEGIGTSKYKFTVYAVTEKLFDTNDSKGTIGIDGKTYYVLDSSEEEEQIAGTGGLTINLMARHHENYVPVNTNASKTLDLDDPSKNVLVFEYQPIKETTSTVRFVKAGTEGTTNEEVVLSEEVTTNQIVTTPSERLLKELTAKGYELVNKDGDKYEAVAEYSALTWLDEDGNVHDFGMYGKMSNTQLPTTVTYLVRPIEYQITYETADPSMKEAVDAVSALKNPKTYTIEDAFTLTNPGAFEYNDKQYTFSHWSLGTGTTSETGTSAYSTLAVKEGSFGNLKFIANWKVDDKTSGDSENDKPVTPPTSEEEKEDVNTGDTMQKGAWLFLTAVSGFTLLVLLLKKRREEDTQS